MSEYKIAILSDGREIKVDVEALGRDIKTRRDLKALNSMSPLSDEYDAWIAKYSGLTADELIDMPRLDYRAVEKAMSAAVQELTSPN